MLPQIVALVALLASASAQQPACTTTLFEVPHFALTCTSYAFTEIVTSTVSSCTGCSVAVSKLGTGPACQTVIPSNNTVAQTSLVCATPGAPEAPSSGLAASSTIPSTMTTYAPSIIARATATAAASRAHSAAESTGSIFTAGSANCTRFVFPQQINKPESTTTVYPATKTVSVTTTNTDANCACSVSTHLLGPGLQIPPASATVTVATPSTTTVAFEVCATPPAGPAPSTPTSFLTSTSKAAA